MNVTVDTNILLRGAQPGHPQHQPSIDALAVIRTRGDTTCVIPQNLTEFWATATRPVAANGLGMTPAEAAAELAIIKAMFVLLPDTPAVYPEWEMLVTTVGVRGRETYDARIAAAMRVHGVTHILTFNVADFRRYPGITAVSPDDVLAAP